MRDRTDCARGVWAIRDTRVLRGEIRIHVPVRCEIRVERGLGAARALRIERDLVVAERGRHVFPFHVE